MQLQPLKYENSQLFSVLCFTFQQKNNKLINEVKVIKENIHWDLTDKYFKMLHRKQSQHALVLTLSNK